MRALWALCTQVMLVSLAPACARQAPAAKGVRTHASATPSAAQVPAGTAPAPPPAVSARFMVRTPIPKGGVTVYSPDGRMLLTSSSSGAALLDAVSGEAVGAFPEEAGLSGAAFSPDGARVALATADARVRFISVATGTQERVHELFTEQDMGGGAKRRLRLVARCLSFTSKGDVVVGLTKLGVVTLQTSGAAPMRLVPIQGEHLALLDDRTVVVGDTSDIAVYELPTGALKRRIEGLHKREIQSLHVIQGTSRVVSMAADGVVKVTDAGTGRTVRTFDSVPRRALEAHAAGASGITMQETEFPTALAVSPDGKKAVTASALDAKGALEASDYAGRFWDLGTGQLARRVPFKSHVHAAAFSPSGTTVALGGAALHFFDLTTRKMARVSTDPVAPVRWVQVSEDGGLALSGAADELVLWDLRTLELLRRWHVPGLTRTAPNPWGNHPTCAAFSRDNRRAAVGTYSGAIVILDLRTGALLADLRAAPGKGPVRANEPGHWHGVWELVFLADDKVLFAKNGQSSVLLSAADGSPVRPGNEHLPWSRIVGTPSAGLGRALSRDGARLAYVDARNGIVECAAEDANRGYCPGSPSKVRVLNDAVLSDLPLVGNAHPIAFFPQGDRLATLCEKGRSVCVWDLAARKLVRALRGHRDAITALSIRGDGLRVLSSSLDGTIRSWNVATGDAVSMVGSGTDWVVYTDDGLFDASPTGGRLVFMADGHRALGIESFAALNNRPDLILARTGDSPPELVGALEATHERRMRRMGVKAMPGAALPQARILKVEASQGSAAVELELQAGSAELVRYDVTVNGVPVHPEGKAASGTHARLSEVVDLTPGSNRIEVSCTGQDGRESHRAFAFVDRAEPAPADLYFLAFGVSDYRDDRLDLQYAHKDAADLAAAFSGARRGYRQVHVRSLVNGEVTLQAIRDSAGFLAAARPQDTVVMFIAGHGFHERDAEATYYFLTHEADVQRLAQTAAPYELLEELLHKTRARRKLFLMDTCASGEATEEQRAAASAPRPATTTLRGARALTLAIEGAPRSVYERRRNRFVFTDLMKRSGAVVFSSSHGDEMSLEVDSRKNGLFTAALLDALTTTRADIDGDKVVSRSELEDFVRAEVSRASAGRQNPTIDRDNLSALIDLPVVRGLVPGQR